MNNDPLKDLTGLGDLNDATPENNSPTTSFPSFNEIYNVKKTNGEILIDPNDVQAHEDDDFYICLKADTAAPGRCEIKITSCLKFKDVQTKWGLKDQISLTFDVVDVYGKLYQIEERVFCPGPQQTKGRYFTLFGDLFRIFGSKSGTTANSLVGKAGYATLAYTISEDQSQSWPNLTDFSTQR